MFCFCFCLFVCLSFGLVCFLVNILIFIFHFSFCLYYSLLVFLGGWGSKLLGRRGKNRGSASEMGGIGVLDVKFPPKKSKLKYMFKIKENSIWEVDNIQKVKHTSLEYCVNLVLFILLKKTALFTGSCENSLFWFMPFSFICFFWIAIWFIWKT